MCQFCSTAAANAPIQVERYLPSDVIVESPSPSRSRKLSRQVSSTFENNSSNGNGNNTNNELNRSAQFVISTVNSAPNSPAKSLRLNTSTISTVSTNSTANGYVSLADSLAEKGTFIRMRTRQAPPNWQIDTKISACNICKQTFGLTLRRHHCRYCGKIFW